MFGKRLTLALALVGMGVIPLTSQAAVVLDDFKTGVPFNLLQAGNGSTTGTRTGSGILGGVFDAQINTTGSLSPAASQLLVFESGGTGFLSLTHAQNATVTTTLAWDATSGFGNYTPPGVNFTPAGGVNDSIAFNYFSSQAITLTVNLYDINNVLVATTGYGLTGGVGSLAQIAYSSFTTFGGFNFTQPIGKFEFVVSTSGQAGLQLTIDGAINASSVPEPATMALGATGILVLAGARTIRRRRNAVQA